MDGRGEKGGKPAAKLSALLICLLICLLADRWRRWSTTFEPESEQRWLEHSIAGHLHFHDDTGWIGRRQVRRLHSAGRSRSRLWVGVAGSIRRLGQSRTTLDRFG